MEGLPKNAVLGIHKVKKSCGKTFHEAKKHAEKIRFADINNLDKKNIQKSRKDCKENGNNCAKNHNEKLCLTNET